MSAAPSSVTLSCDTTAQVAVFWRRSMFQQSVLNSRSSTLWPRQRLCSLAGFKKVGTTKLTAATFYRLQRLNHIVTDSSLQLEGNCHSTLQHYCVFPEGRICAAKWPLLPHCSLGSSGSDFNCSKFNYITISTFDLVNSRPTTNCTNNGHDVKHDMLNH